MIWYKAYFIEYIGFLERATHYKMGGFFFLSFQEGGETNEFWTKIVTQHIAFGINNELISSSF